MGRLAEWIKKRLGVKKPSHKEQNIELDVAGETVDAQNIKKISCEEMSGAILKTKETGITAEKLVESVEKAFTKEPDAKRERIVFAMTNNERRRRGIPLKRRRGFAAAKRNERRAGRSRG